MYTSVPIDNTMEYVANVEISPLISKGYCKVCYVGQDPNRNNTVITKEVATEMGRKLPGSPVVGFYNKEMEDFDGHNREVIVKDGKFEIVDITRPYGFVPDTANVWFQKFADGGIEHEYLCCDVYIWTHAYPESQRIFDKGNNQSMELTEDEGFWTNNDKTNARVFIYNEALIEKLCILGENVEPCFEGASIGGAFSLENDATFQEFKNAMFSMITELQETLSKGGSQELMEDLTLVTAEEEVIEIPEEFEKKEPEVEEKEAKKQEEKEEEDEKKSYNLDDIVEYSELMGTYNQLQSDYNALLEEVTALREFKLVAERQSKQQMIDSFYMLSDSDKQDVINNIDTYSLDDIEAKLSILCVRNRVNFNLEETPVEQASPQGLFNLDAAIDTDSAPAWIKAVRATSSL